MLEELHDMPGSTLGFRATGHVTGDEYKNQLLPALEAAVETGDVRLLFVAGPGFERFDPGAWAEDSKAALTLGIGHHAAWKRFAIATDVSWIADATHMFAWMCPGEVAVFGLDELDQARDWLVS